MATQERVVRHAVFAYTDADGVYCTALRGDKIQIGGAELERGERFGVFFDDEDEAAVALDLLAGALVGDDEDLDDGEDDDNADPATSPPGATPDEVAAAAAAAAAELASTEGAGDEPERPALAANKPLWVDFRVAESKGRFTPAQLDELTKPELQDDEFIAALQPASAS